MYVLFYKGKMIKLFPLYNSGILYQNKSELASFFLKIIKYRVIKFKFRCNTNVILTTYKMQPAKVNKELEHSFVTNLEQNQNIVHKVCRIYTNDQESHNDLFQEITIQLWKAYPKFRGDAKFSTWMYRVALNTAITLYRKSKRSIKTSDIDTISFRIKVDEYDDEIEQQLKLMYAAVKQLNDIEKALVFLYLEDKSYREIADTMGISEVNARVKMNRVKTKLKKILNP